LNTSTRIRLTVGCRFTHAGSKIDQVGASDPPDGHDALGGHGARSNPGFPFSQ
jgi:hypothetical protein